MTLRGLRLLLLLLLLLPTLHWLRHGLWHFWRHCACRGWGSCTPHLACSRSRDWGLGYTPPSKRGFHTARCNWCSRARLGREIATTDTAGSSWSSVDTDFCEELSDVGAPVSLRHQLNHPVNMASHLLALLEKGVLVFVDHDSTPVSIGTVPRVHSTTHNRLDHLRRSGDVSNHRETNKTQKTKSVTSLLQWQYVHKKGAHSAAWHRPLPVKSHVGDISKSSTTVTTTTTSETTHIIEIESSP